MALPIASATRSWEPPSQRAEAPDPSSEVVSELKVSDFIDIAAPETHIVRLDGTVTGDPHFKYDFTDGIDVFS